MGRSHPRRPVMAADYHADTAETRDRGRRLSDAKGVLADDGLKVDRGRKDWGWIRRPSNVPHVDLVYTLLSCEITNKK